MIHLSQNMTEVKRYKNVNKKLPILAIRGEEDSSTGFEKGSRASIKVLKSAGFHCIKQINYPDMRHEILNERGREKVYQDIVKFLNSGGLKN